MTTTNNISNPFLPTNNNDDNNNDDEGGSNYKKCLNLYCNVSNQGCKYAWYFTIQGLLYLKIHLSCTGLIFRLLMQLVMITASWMAIARFVTAWILHKQIQTTKNHKDTIHDKVCIVRKTELVPEKPIPNFPQRCITTIRFLDEEDDDDEGSTTERGINTMSSSSSRENQKVESSPSDDNDDNLKVITDPKEDKIQVGDKLLVTLPEGDVGRVTYIPYLQHSIKRMICSGLQTIVIALAAYALLAYVMMSDVPVAFASSASVEMSLQSSWWCTLGLDDDMDDEAKNKELEDCCRITTSTTWAYNLFIGVNLVAVILIFFYCRWMVATANNNNNNNNNKEGNTKEEEEKKNNHSIVHDQYSALELT